MTEAASAADGPRSVILAYSTSTLLVVLAVGVARLIESTVLPSNLSLVFVTAVLASALRYGLWPSVFASVLSMLAWNYFFLPPTFTFGISDPQDMLALVLFLIVSVVVSNLAALKQRQNETIAARAKITAQLYALSEKIAATGSLQALLPVVVGAIGVMLECEVTIWLSRDGALSVAACFPPATVILEDDTEIARRLWRNDSGPLEVGPGRDGKTRIFQWLRTERGGIGIVALQGSADRRLALDDERLLSILLDQTAVAIERVQLAEAIDQARLDAETERLRSAMLTSLSHDLRTPLTGIIAALSVMQGGQDSVDPDDRDALLCGARDEAERLDRFIGNLLDMTRLQSGGLRLRLEPIDIGEAIQSAVARGRSLTNGHRVAIDAPPELPMAMADFLLTEQVVFNLLDNAAKYAQAGTVIAIAARADGNHISIEVMDEGPGIPPDSLGLVFDKFARVAREDRQQPGTGLGLAICRGFLQAMGGEIEAANRTDRSGAVFRARLAQATCQDMVS